MECSVGSEIKPLGTRVIYRYNTIVMTAMAIKCDGNVTSWEFYARDRGVFYASVWREEGIGHYVLVGRNLVNATDIGRQVRHQDFSFHLKLVSAMVKVTRCNFQTV